MSITSCSSLLLSIREPDFSSLQAFSRCIHYDDQLAFNIQQKLTVELCGLICCFDCTLKCNSLLKAYQFQPSLKILSGPSNPFHGGICAFATITYELGKLSPAQIQLISECFESAYKDWEFEHHDIENADTFSTPYARRVFNVYGVNVPLFLSCVKSTGRHLLFVGGSTALESSITDAVCSADFVKYPGDIYVFRCIRLLLESLQDKLCIHATLARDALHACYDTQLSSFELIRRCLIFISHVINGTNTLKSEMFGGLQIDAWVKKLDQSTRARMVEELNTICSYDEETLLNKLRV